MPEQPRPHGDKQIVEQEVLVPAAAATIAVSIQDFPEGGYGWVVVACIFVINFMTWGNATSYGVYLATYLTENSFHGATPLDFALVGGMQFGISMLLAPIVTPISRVLHLRPTVLIGIFIHSSGWVFASLVGGRLWALYLTQGVMIGIGLAFIFIPVAAVLPQYFWKRRTLAVSLGSAGAGLGGLVFSIVTEPMIHNLGISWSLRITGIICFVCETAATLFLKDRNKRILPTQHGFATYLVRRESVLLLLAHSFLVMLGYIPVIYSISSYAKSLGIGDFRASLATAFVNLGVFFGRPFTGFLSDRYGRFELALLCAIASAIFCFAVWIPTNSWPTLIILSILIGAVCGSFWSMIAAMAADVAGVQETPSMLSLCWLSVVLPTTFAEVAALYLRQPDSSRPYLYVQVFAGAAYLLSSLPLVQLIRRKRNAKSQTSNDER